MSIIVLIAALGLITNILGRALLIREDTALSTPAKWMVATLPGADVIYMIVRWERARVGTLICAFSFAMFLPLVGQLSTNIRMANASGQSVSFFSQVLALAHNERPLTNDPRVHELDEKRVAAKREKLTELHTYLQKWYVMLEERKGYLCSELPAETVVFNRDAAAYHGLLAVEKRELAELQELETGGR